MEAITKRITTTEVIEYIAVCSKCNTRFIGSTEGAVAFLLVTHKQGRGCKK